ncbi:MAG: hypothetical protein RH862_03465 [Leptospiraceae bacterium]
MRMRLSIKHWSSTLVLLLAVGLLMMISLPVLGRVYEKPKEALNAVFPGATIERKPVYLSKAEQKSLSEQSGKELKSRFYTFYEARKNGQILGYGTYVTDVVRTKEQTLFIAVNSNGQVKDVRLISFFEPEEYRPPERWLDLLNGKSLSNSIQPGKDLPAMSGASLTSRSTADNTRMVLAIVKLKLQ